MLEPTTSGTSLRTSSSLILNWLTIWFGLAVAQGGVAVSLLLLARRLSPLAFSAWVASYALATLTVVLPNFGLDSWLLAFKNSNFGAIAETWRSTLRARMAFLAVWLPLLLLIVHWLPSDVYPPLLVGLIGIGVATESVTLLSHSALRLLRQHKRIAAWQAVFAAGLIALSIGLPSDPHLMEWFAAGRLALSLIIASAILGRGFQAIKHVPPLMPTSQILAAARPFAVSDIAVMLYWQSDVTIVSLVLGAAGTAIYGPAVAILNVAFLGSRALFLLSVPVLARIFAESRSGFRRAALTQLSSQLIVGAALTLVVALFASETIELILGSAYAASGPYLRTLSLVVFFRSANFGLGAWLMVADLQAPRARWQVFSAMFSVAANLWAVSAFGVGGVATVYVFSELLLAFGYAVILYRGSAWKAKA